MVFSSLRAIDGMTTFDLPVNVFHLPVKSGVRVAEAALDHLDATLRP